MVINTTKEKVITFVKENLVRGDNSKFHCIDERFRQEQSEGAVRAPGGDFGMIMAFAASLKDEGTHLGNEEIVERYLRAVRKKRGDTAALSYHSDDQGHEIGCGHIAKASSPENAGLYGSLTYKEIKDLYQTFVKHPSVQRTDLQGPHGADGVLFVHGQSSEGPIPYSIHSQDEAGSQKFFVVDVDRVYRFIDKATPLFSEGLLKPVDPSDVKANFRSQLNATAGLIAADLEKFKITIDPDGKTSVEQLPKDVKLT